MSQHSHHLNIIDNIQDCASVLEGSGGPFDDRLPGELTRFAVDQRHAIKTPKGAENAVKYMEALIDFHVDSVSQQPIKRTLERSKEEPTYRFKPNDLKRVDRLGQTADGPRNRDDHDDLHYWSGHSLADTRAKTLTEAAKQPVAPTDKVRSGRSSSPSNR